MLVRVSRSKANLVAVCVLTLQLAHVAAPAEARGRIERVVDVPYEVPKAGVDLSPVAGVLYERCYEERAPDGCGYVDTRQGELYVALEVTDEMGLPVYASVLLDMPSGLYATKFCGRSETLAIPPRTRVAFTLWNASSTCLSAATEGTVTVTFSSRP